jgi:hypothetical protein
MKLSPKQRKFLIAGLAMLVVAQAASRIPAVPDAIKGLLFGIAIGLELWAVRLRADRCAS